MGDWTGEHKELEKNGVWFTIFVTIAISIGGLVEIVPPVLIGSPAPMEDGVKPYSALELAGRDVYIAEGCSGCHSQMIRPFHWEAVRFGDRSMADEDIYSSAGEYVYDRPFLWGSKRTGPDLWRESTLHDADWHYIHFLDPTMNGKMKDTVMPAYPWLFEKRIPVEEVIQRMEILNRFGTYKGSNAIYLERARQELEGKRQIDALIAYMLKLGRDRKEKLERNGNQNQ